MRALVTRFSALRNDLNTVARGRNAKKGGRSRSSLVNAKRPRSDRGELLLAHAGKFANHGTCERNVIIQILHFSPRHSGPRA